MPFSVPAQSLKLPETPFRPLFTGVLLPLNIIRRPKKAIRWLFVKVFLKTAKVSNVSNAVPSMPKRVFDSISLQRGVKNEGVSNVSNGLGNSKG